MDDKNSNISSVDVQEGIVFINYHNKKCWFNKTVSQLLLIDSKDNDLHQLQNTLLSLIENAVNYIEVKNKIIALLNNKIHNEGNITISFEDYNLNITYSFVDWNNEKVIHLIIKKDKKLDIHLASHQVKELSNLLIAVLNSSHSGIMAFKSCRDHDNKIVDFDCLLANEMAKKILKKKEYELVGQKLKKILSDSLQDVLFEKYREVVNKGNPYIDEIKLFSDGSVTWTNINAIKLEDGFSVTLTDITKRKYAEEKLLRDQAKLEAVLENTDDYIWSIDNDYLITTINTAFQKKVYLQTGHIIKVGTRFDLEIFPKEAIPKWRGFFSKAFSGKQFTEEVSIQISDAAYCLEYSFNPIKDSSHKVIGVAIIGRDITVRINTEKEIRKKSQMLNSLLNNLPVFVFRIDSEGNIQEAKGAALAKLNIIESDVIGVKASEIFNEVEEALIKVRKGQSVKIQSTRWLEGKECTYEKHIFPDQTRQGGAIGFAIDVSELKFIEAEIKKAKETAERANRAKNYFLANMSHDLRTPIHTILGFANILKENTPGGDSLDHLKYIISSADLLYKLVDDILQLTKIEEGKLELKEEPFNFKETLLSNLYPYQFQVNENGLDFKLDFDERLPEYVLGDVGKISRIVINLIGNSLKFTSKGFIYINFHCVNPQSKGNIKEVQITVKDSGIGISKEKHEIIFNSFTQAEPSINSSYGGSGLGLAIVKELVTLMGGTFGVESPIQHKKEVGGPGSAFWVNLPLLEVSSNQVVEPKGKSNENIDYNGSIRVLVVDDNYINQQLVKAILSKIGCHVDLAENGKETLKILKKNNFDLILMDVQMPVMDGTETTFIIRKKLKSVVPIIGLSANIYKDEIDKCLRSGMTDYLSKPFKEQALLEKIFYWLPIKKVNITETSDSQHSGNKLSDLSFLMNLYKGDVAQVKKVVQEFVHFQHQILQKMEENLNKNNIKELAPLAHNMRSSLSTVGLEALNEPLIKLEQMALKKGGTEEIEQVLNHIKIINGEAEKELNKNI